MDTSTAPRPTRMRLAVVGFAAAAAALLLPTVPSSATADDRPTADSAAIWAVLRTLPSADVAVLHAGLNPIVQQELTAMVDAVAGSLYSR